MARSVESRFRTRPNPQLPFLVRSHSGAAPSVRQQVPRARGMRLGTRRGTQPSFERLACRPWPGRPMLPNGTAPAEMDSHSGPTHPGPVLRSPAEPRGLRRARQDGLLEPLVPATRPAQLLALSTPSRSDSRLTSTSHAERPPDRFRQTGLAPSHTLHEIGCEAPNDLRSDPVQALMARILKKTLSFGVLSRGLIPRRCYRHEGLQEALGSGCLISPATRDRRVRTD